MTSLQCLKHEWLCQTEKIEKEEVKNNPEDHSSSGKGKDQELNTTKHNLSQSKGQWDPSHNYVMFDCETRTMSRADPRDDDEDDDEGNHEEEILITRDDDKINNICVTKDESDKENEEINDCKESSASLCLANNCENNYNDCRKRMANGEDNDYLEAAIGVNRKRSKTPLVEGNDDNEKNKDSRSTLTTPNKANLTNAASSTITYDQVQQRANEIRETKRMSVISYDSLDDSCSIIMKSKEATTHSNEVDDEVNGAIADDEETTTDGGPTPTPDISEISIPCNSIKDTNIENPTPLPTHANIIANGESDVQNSKTFSSELPEQTLWQAAEGTVTPFWEFANVGEIPSLGNLHNHYVL